MVLDPPQPQPNPLNQKHNAKRTGGLGDLVGKELEGDSARLVVPDRHVEVYLRIAWVVCVSVCVFQQLTASPVSIFGSKPVG